MGQIRAKNHRQSKTTRVDSFLDPSDDDRSCWYCSYHSSSERSAYPELTLTNEGSASPFVVAQFYCAVWVATSAIELRDYERVSRLKKFMRIIVSVQGLTAKS